MKHVMKTPLKCHSFEAEFVTPLSLKVPSGTEHSAQTPDYYVFPPFFSRFGTGSEHVEEYTTVTADGDILVINKDNVTKLDPHGHGYGGTEVVEVSGRGKT